MNNNKFDYFIPEFSKKLTGNFLDILNSVKELTDHDIDTSPLLNLTMGVYLSSLRQILELIKSHTDGEERLIMNIELTEKLLIKFLEDLPFVEKIESY